MGKITPPKDWPSRGKIEFKNIKLRYRPKLEQVLKGISMVIEPEMKVGVVGRTGAGKSTISMSISRVLELDSGSIEIDGIDISQVGLRTLRKHITMILQEAALFKNTLKFNLDP